MDPTLDRVLGMRLTTQRLTCPSLPTVEDVVRRLVCVQAQDAPLARWSLGMRTGLDDQAVRAVLDSGQVLRTHVLRPTWHYLLAADLRWLLALTSDKVVSAMGARHRRLDLGETAVRRAHDQVVDALGGGAHLTRRQLADRLDRPDLRGERLGHVLLLAELRGIVCSGPLSGGQHTYALVDERVPPMPPRPRQDAIRDLVHRFYAGHGPASVAHLMRWTTLTKHEVTAAIADFRDRLASLDLGDERLWFDPTAQGPAPAGSHAFLLPVFDDAYLSYPGSGFPRLDGHPRGGRPHSFAEAGGGVVVCDLRDVGWWKRRDTRRTTQVTLALSTTLTAPQRHRIEAEAHRLAAFTGRGLELLLA